MTKKRGRVRFIGNTFAHRYRRHRRRHRLSLYEIPKVPTVISNLGSSTSSLYEINLIANVKIQRIHVYSTFRIFIVYFKRCCSFKNVNIDGKCKSIFLLYTKIEVTFVLVLQLRMFSQVVRIENNI